MLEKWKPQEGKETEVFEEFRVLTSEVIWTTAFGSSYIEGKSIFEKLNKLTILTSRNIFRSRVPGLSDEIESEKLEKGLRDSITGIIKKRKTTVSEGDNYGNDLLGLLVKAKNDPDENNRITIDDVVDECKTFYFAGHETTSALLAWTILLLAIHTDWQDEAREEVLELFGQQHPNADGIARMKAMSMVINESQRLYPPISTIGRKFNGKLDWENWFFQAI